MLDSVKEVPYFIQTDTSDTLQGKWHFWKRKIPWNIFCSRETQKYDFKPNWYSPSHLCYYPCKVFATCIW